MCNMRDHRGYPGVYWCDQHAEIGDEKGCTIGARQTIAEQRERIEKLEAAFSVCVDMFHPGPIIDCKQPNCVRIRALLAEAQETVLDTAKELGV